MIKWTDIPTKHVIEACRDFHAGKGKSPSVALYFNKGYPEEATLQKMQKLVDRGVLEMGFCIRTAWVAGEQTYEPTIGNRAAKKQKTTKKKKRKEEIF